MRRAALRPCRRLIVIPAALAIGASTLMTTPAAGTSAGLAADSPANVEVVDLRINGRYDNPLLGVGDPSPVLSWRMKATRASASHRCHRSGPEVACPADEQTAYQLQAANSVSDLNRGDLIWDSGKVAGGVQSGVPYAGPELSSREAVVWRVRVWDADGAPSGWSGPGAWEMGLLDQSDWADARWIDYPGRTESQPQPIFARRFDLQGDVAKARLYVSGLGLHEATVNGQELTDEALAPGYRTSSCRPSTGPTTSPTSSSVARTHRRPARQWHRVRPAQRDQPGRRAHHPVLMVAEPDQGLGRRHRGAAAGATNVKVSSVANYHLGGTVNIDTGRRRRPPRVAGHLQHRHRSDDGRRPERHHRNTGADPDRRELGLERRRRQHDHPGRPDRPPQDLRGGGSRGAGHRGPPRECRRRPHHLRQRHAGLGVHRRQQRMADLADLRHQVAARSRHQRHRDRAVQQRRRRKPHRRGRARRHAYRHGRDVEDPARHHRDPARRLDTPGFDDSGGCPPRSPAPMGSRPGTRTSRRRRDRPSCASRACRASPPATRSGSTPGRTRRRRSSRASAPRAPTGPASRSPRR